MRLEQSSYRLATIGVRLLAITAVVCLAPGYAAAVTTKTVTLECTDPGTLGLTAPSAVTVDFIPIGQSPCPAPGTGSIGTATTPVQPVATVCAGVMTAVAAAVNAAGAAAGIVAAGPVGPTSVVTVSSTPPLYTKYATCLNGTRIVPVSPNDPTPPAVDVDAGADLMLVDSGGKKVKATNVPTLSPVALGLLLAALSGAGMELIRRRRSV